MSQAHQPSLRGPEFPVAGFILRTVKRLNAWLTAELEASDPAWCSDPKCPSSTPCPTRQRSDDHPHRPDHRSRPSAYIALGSRTVSKIKVTEGASWLDEGPRLRRQVEVTHARIGA